MRILYQFLGRIGSSAVVGILLLCTGVGIAIADVATSTDATSTPISITTATTTIATSTPIITLDTATSSSSATTLQAASSTQPSIATTTASTTLPIFTPTTVASSSVKTAISSVPMVIEQLTCTMAYTATLYDTPSGHLDAGYLLATTTEIATGTSTQKVAHVLGAQSWVDCRDSKDNTHEFKLTQQEYSALSEPNAVMPEETASVPIN